jgi:hypothetical protein
MSLFHSPQKCLSISDIGGRRKRSSRNPPLKENLSPIESGVEGFASLNVELLRELHDYCDDKLLFKDGAGFDAGSYPMNFWSCVQVMTSLCITESSVVLEFG